jgi:hypothetical protein
MEIEHEKGFQIQEFELKQCRNGRCYICKFNNITSVNTKYITFVI